MSLSESSSMSNNPLSSSSTVCSHESVDTFRCSTSWNPCYFPWHWAELHSPTRMRWKSLWIDLRKLIINTSKNGCSTSNAFHLSHPSANNSRFQAPSNNKKFIKFQPPKSPRWRYRFPHEKHPGNSRWYPSLFCGTFESLRRFLWSLWISHCRDSSSNRATLSPIWLLSWILVPFASIGSQFRVAWSRIRSTNVSGSTLTARRT